MWSHKAPSEPSTLEIQNTLGQFRGSAGLWLGGGEPTLRDDLTTIINAAAEGGVQRVGLVTDAITFAQGHGAAALRDAGLDRVQARFSCSRLDAHDWLTGCSESGRKSLRGIQRLVRSSFSLAVEVPLTRPTSLYLVETIELLHRLGVRSIVIRRVGLGNTSRDLARCILPRLDWRVVQAATAAARSFGLRIDWTGFPLCVLKRGDAPLEESEIVWYSSIGSVLSGVQTVLGDVCRPCEHSGVCSGIPADHVELFGWQDIEEAVATCTRGRAGTGRVTAPLAMTSAAAVEERDPPSSDLTPPPTRELRREVVRLARLGFHRLSLQGFPALPRPLFDEVVTEARQLGFEEIELICDPRLLHDLPASALKNLPVDICAIEFYGPDAAAHDRVAARPGSFAESLEALARLCCTLGEEATAIAVVDDHHQLPSYAEAWANDQLLRTAVVRLGRKGGCLEALAAAASRLPSSSIAASVWALLPFCLRADAYLPTCERDATADTSGLWGQFDACQFAPVCAVADSCPGIARGWTATALRPFTSPEGPTE